jgi:transcription initiation factor TFIIH subunit 2
MGFPHMTDPELLKTPSFCSCHPPTPENPEAANLKSGYFCPQCSSKYCQIPVECRTCGLTLASAPHLARSYHHLFPLKPFTETSLAEAVAVMNDAEDLMGHYCEGCACHLQPNKTVYQCEDCGLLFCSECDIFLHESLHNCPGCVAKGSK